MREIIFKAYLPKENKITFSHTLEEIVSICSLGYPDNAIWMQCTSLKDKNFKDIYEGDILGCLGFGKFRVEFFNGMFCAFKISEESNQENAYRIDWLIKTYQMEIIANIHENSELL